MNSVLCNYCGEFFDYEDHRDTLIVIRGPSGPRWLCGPCNGERKAYQLRRIEHSMEMKAKFAVLCEEYSHTCPCCGITGVKLTIDHIVPKSQGGSDDITNLQPLCRGCNAKKGNHHRKRYPKPRKSPGQPDMVA